MVSKFSKIIASGVQITTKVTDHCFDHGIKGQGKLYLESVLKLITQAPLVFFDMGASYFVQWLPIWSLSQRSRSNICNIWLQMPTHLTFVTEDIIFDTMFA